MLGSLITMDLNHHSSKNITIKQGNFDNGRQAALFCKNAVDYGFRIWVSLFIFRKFQQQSKSLKFEFTKIIFHFSIHFSGISTGRFTELDPQNHKLAFKFDVPVLTGSLIHSRKRVILQVYAKYVSFSWLIFSLIFCLSNNFLLERVKTYKFYLNNKKRRKIKANRVEKFEATVSV